MHFAMFMTMFIMVWPDREMAKQQDQEYLNKLMVALIPADSRLHKLMK